MTEDEFRTLFPQSSDDVVRRSLAAANAAPVRKAPSPEPERTPGPPLESPKQDQVRHSGKCLVRCQSSRVRLCDPDNEIFKWHLDALRYAGILRDDSTDEIELQIAPQIKVATFAEEITVITITPIPEISGVEAAKLFAEAHDALALEGKRG